MMTKYIYRFRKRKNDNYPLFNWAAGGLEIGFLLDLPSMYHAHRSILGYHLSSRLGSQYLDWTFMWLKCHFVVAIGAVVRSFLSPAHQAR